MRRLTDYWIIRHFRIFRSAKKDWSVNHSNIVISTGGVATTALMQYLSNFIHINCPDDSDGLKHKPKLPQKLYESDVKILFIYGSINTILSSLDRRGYLRIQSAKLGSFIAAFSPRFITRILLERALKSQITAFKVGEQLYPDKIFCIHFDEIWTKKNEIAGYFGVDNSRFVKHFPNKRSRKSI